MPDAAEDGPFPLRRGGRFRNPWPDSGPSGFLAFLRWQLARRVAQETRQGARATPAPAPGKPSFISPRAAAGELTATWIGHSTVLVQLGDLNILTDPMWSERASPLGFAGPRRLVAPGVALANLPPIDLVLLSHDHYDHLDDESVRRVAARWPGARWLVPLGLRDFVRQRGGRRVHEATWWDGVDEDGLRARAVPAQHHSARGLRDRGRTLWCGWSVEFAGRRLYFAGDTAYHPDFARVGERLGPFDLTLMPIGAYEPRWFMRTVHMNPEEAVRAFVEVGGPSDSLGAMLPIHWGTFRLTDEPPEEPRQRIIAAWEAAGLPTEDLWLLDQGASRRR